MALGPFVHLESNAKYIRPETGKNYDCWRKIYERCGKGRWGRGAERARVKRIGHDQMETLNLPACCSKEKNNHLVFVYINGFLVTSFMLKRKKELLCAAYVCVCFFFFCCFFYSAGDQTKGSIIRSIPTVSTFSCCSTCRNTTTTLTRVMQKDKETEDGQPQRQQPFFGGGDGWCPVRSNRKDSIYLRYNGQWDE